MKSQTFKAYEVYLQGKHIDTVFYKGYTTEEVKESLINHDGYDTGIAVKERKVK